MEKEREGVNLGKSGSAFEKSKEKSYLFAKKSGKSGGKEKSMDELSDNGCASITRGKKH